MLMEAHEAYRAGNIDTALLKYAMLAELGYEVAQSNVAYILDHGKFVSCIAIVYSVSNSFRLVKPSLSPAMLAFAQFQRLNGLDGMDCSISWAFILACVAGVERKGEGREKGRGDWRE